MTINAPNFVLYAVHFVREIIRYVVRGVLNPSFFRRRAAMIAVVVLGLGVFSAGVYYVWLSTPPALPATAQEGLDVLQSPRFAHLPEYRQHEYRVHIDRMIAALSADQRRALFSQLRENSALRKSLGQVREDAMLDRAIKFAQAAPAQRRAMLQDDRQFGGFFPGRPTSQPASQPDPGGPPRGPRDMSRMMRRMEQRVQNGNPQQNGLMTEYFQARRAAAQQSAAGR